MQNTAEYFRILQNTTEYYRIQNTEAIAALVGFVAVALGQRE